MQPNTIPSGKRRLERKEPNRRKHVQKSKYEGKSKKEAGVSSSMLKHLKKIKLLSTCITRAVKTLQHFSNIICLEWIITQHVPEKKKALNKREMATRQSLD